MTNQDIKAKAKLKGVYLWQIAEKLGVNDGNFSRKLRKELSADEKQRIFAIIDEIAAANKNAVKGATNTLNG